MIVPTPTRTLWQVVLEHPIYHFDGFEHDRIARTANPKAHQVKKIATHHVARGMEPAAVGDLEHRCVRIGVGVWRVRTSRIYADVMMRNALDQLARGRDRPLFEVRH